MFLPFATQVFERAAKAYIYVEENDVYFNSGSFNVVLDYYLKYKAMMLQKDKKTTDESVFKMN